MTKWNRCFTNGHTYFQDAAGRIAIADGSMTDHTNPETTDDGLLLVNKDRSIEFSRRGMCSIPLVNREGVSSWASGTWKEGVMVCRSLGCRATSTRDVHELVTELAQLLNA